MVAAHTDSGEIEGGEVSANARRRRALISPSRTCGMRGTLALTHAGFENAAGTVTRQYGRHSPDVAHKYLILLARPRRFEPLLPP